MRGIPSFDLSIDSELSNIVSPGEIAVVVSLSLLRYISRASTISLTRQQSKAGQMIEKQIEFKEVERRLGEYAPFFQLNLLSLPASAEKIVEAFCVAAGCIVPAIRIKRQIVITFGTSPFSLTNPPTTLSVNLQEPVINTTFGDFIFLDWQKMKTIAYQHIVASILEELVHSLMNVQDESVAMRIVASLYSGVKVSANSTYELV
ncbi:MAG: hypothetical protein NTZ35_01985 [Ignavibacteriales bacterium]|nr:hypothetical protein [Ignavibacteriales bacterium]